MKFQRAIIYGFGKWVDHTIDFKNGSFICIFGENESGKSTLQQFLLFMLFGLPPKQRDFFRPKTSGTMGGRLTVSDEEAGNYTIERMDGVRNGAALIYLENGETLDESWLKSKLKGITHEIYRSIFAFSATDLESIKQIKDEELGEILLGVGLTGSDKLYRIEKKLQQQMGDLFKPYGKVPEMNKQLALLDDLMEKNKAFKDTEAMYQQKIFDLQDTKEEINELKETLEHHKNHLLYNQKVKQFLPTIKELKQSTIQLDRFPKILKFPEQGVSRLQNLKNNLLPLQSEASILEENERKKQQQMNDIKKKIKGKEVIDTCHLLLRKKSTYEEHISSIEICKKRQANIKAEIETIIRNNNISLTNEDLDYLNIPFHTNQQWEALKRETDQLTLEKEHMNRQLEQKMMQRESLQQEIENLEASLLLEEEINKLELVVTSDQEQRLFKQMQHNHMKKLSKWKQTKQKQMKQTKLFLLISFFVSIVSSLFAFIVKIPLLHILSISFILIGIGLRLFTIRQLKQTETLWTTNEVSHESNPYDQHEVLEAKRKIKAQAERKKEITSIYSQIKEIDFQIKTMNEKLSEIHSSSKLLQKNIDKERERFPFLQDVHVAYWPELLYVLRQLLELRDQLKEQSAALKNAVEAAKQYENKVNLFLREQNLIKAQTDTKTKLLEKIIDDHKEMLSLKSEYERELMELQERKNSLKSKIKTYEEEMSHLFALAAVDNEEQFYKQSEIVATKHQLKDKVSELRANLRANFSADTVKELEGKGINEQQLILEAESLHHQIDSLERSLDKFRNRQATLEVELRDMESSESYAKTLHTSTIEQTKLKKLAIKWSELKVANEILISARKSYRSKHLTKVIEKTEMFFKAITLNAYEAIIPPDDDKPFQVVDTDGIKYDIVELSKGTVDQLYIALRLAMSNLLTIKHGLPFIIDDAFVHFDSNRLQKVGELLRHIADDQQLIIFTCKPDVVNVLKDCRLITLDAGAQSRIVTATEIGGK